MLKAGSESILKPVDEKYRQKTNQMKTGRKYKMPYTEKINVVCVHVAFTYEDVLDPGKIYHSKDCVKKFIEHIGDEVKQLMQNLHNNQ